MSFDEKVRTLLDSIEMPKADREDLYDNLIAVAEGAPTEEHFEFIGHGSFKEAYNAGPAGWVVKFYTIQEMTNKEHRLVSLAQEAGVGEVFLPFYSVRFDRRIVSEYLGDDEDDVIFLDGMILQPFCEAYQDGFDQVGEPPVGITNDEFIEWADEDSLTAEWFNNVLAYFGEEYYNQLLAFIRKYEITDLYPRNLGYLNGVPIILDCLSNIERVK